MPSNVGAAVLQDNFNVASDNYMQGAQVAMRRKQLALQEKSLQNDADAAAEKKRQDNYKYGVAIIQNPELMKGVPAMKQPYYVGQTQALLDKLAGEFASGGNPSLGDLDVKYGGEVSKLFQAKAGLTEAEENIKNVSASLKAVPGLSAEKAETFLRKNVFKQDGTMGDYSPEGLQKSLRENARELVLDNTAVDKYRKGLGVTVQGSTVTKTGMDGARTSKRYNHSLNEDMVFNEEGEPVIRGDKMKLNEPPTAGAISVAGIKLNREEQIMAQVALKGARQKDELVFATDADHTKWMLDPGVNFAVQANVLAAKDHYEEVNGEPFPADAKMNELLEKTISHDLMSGGADAKSMEVIEQKAAPAPKITINNNAANTPEQATREYFQETANALEKATGNRGSLASGLGNQAVTGYVMKYLTDANIKDGDKKFEANGVVVRVLPGNKLGVWKSVKKPDIKDGKQVIKAGKPHFLAGSTGEPIAVIDGVEMNMALNKGNVGTGKAPQEQFKTITGGKKYTEVDIRAAAKASGMSVEDYKKAAGL